MVLEGCEVTCVFPQFCVLIYSYIYIYLKAERGIRDSRFIAGGEGGISLSLPS